MAVFRSFLGLSALLVASSNPAQESVALRFGGWEPPAAATVTETWILRDGVVGEDPPSDQGAVFRYRLEVMALGDDLRLSFHDFETLEIGGTDVTTPELAGWGVSANHFSLEYPPMRISRDGDFLGLVDFDSWLETSLQHLESEKPGWQEFDAAPYADPSVRAMLELRSMRRWDAWVTTWTENVFVPGEVREATEPTPVGDFTVEAQVLQEHRGLRKDGLVALRVVARLGGDEMIDALCRMKAEATGAPVPPEGETFRCADEISGSETFEVLTDPATLRPSTAMHESRGGGISGDERYERFESRQYRFEWD